tara:strand:- start:87 stop:287 length:201 start_codon:yes stop_codon:yes gene_type:complete
VVRLKRKKKELVVVVKCDYCGEETETFVVNAEYKKFCRLQIPGKPAEKDCHEDYIKEIKKYANGKR